MNSDLYEKDFYTWLMKNAELLRQGDLSGIDRENVAEELESPGRDDRRQVFRRLEILIGEFLKKEFGLSPSSSAGSITSLGP